MNHLPPPPFPTPAAASSTCITTIELSTILQTQHTCLLPLFSSKTQKNQKKQTLLGEGATVVLDGQRVLPKRTLEAGFKFEKGDLRQALRDIVEK